MKAFSAFNPVSLNSLNFLLLAALLVQFCLIGVKALFMAHFDIPFTWRPFHLLDVSGNIDLWGFDKLYFIYAGIPLIFFISGLSLSFFLQTNLFLNWKARLMLTWVSFFLVNNLLAGMVASLFVFDGIGVAFIWIFPNYLLRLFIGVLAATALMFTRPFWVNLFYKSIYSKSILRDRKSKQQFLSHNFKLPLLLAIPVLLVFAYLSSKWYWPLSVVINVLIAYGFNTLKVKSSRIRILKESQLTFSVKRLLLTHIIILLILLLNTF